MSAFDERGVMALLKQLSEALEAEANNGLRTHGVTISQMRMLAVLGSSDGGVLSLSELRDALGVKQPTAWGIAQRLREKELVSLEESDKDARSKVVRMEPAGMEVYRQAEGGILQSDQRLTGCLTSEEKATLIDLLSRMYEGFVASGE
ncbi:MAG: MarR family transcriptional regulator [Acidobacteriota bacterium]|nr:MarR family transcriptional regulator [Acidobacteriota bacterium]